MLYTIFTESSKLIVLFYRHWRLTIDHEILFCLALTFLTCLILIFISEMHLGFDNCMVISLLFHYTVIAVFGWLLVHAVVYQLRFAKKTDLTEIPHFILKAALSVWGNAVHFNFYWRSIAYYNLRLDTKLWMQAYMR